MQNLGIKKLIFKIRGLKVKNYQNRGSNIYLNLKNNIEITLKLIYNVLKIRPDWSVGPVEMGTSKTTV